MDKQFSDAAAPALSQAEIDRRIFELYDEYCHGGIDRRTFLAQAAVVAAGGLAMAQALFPRYANAQTISFTDPRIKARYVEYDSPGGTSGKMKGYLVQPAGAGPFPAVLVIHENRGLNPYIEDVARRAAAEGFLALAPDGLSPVGGYPGNDDGRALQAGLDQAKLRADMLNGAKFVKAHALSNKKLGVTGFCWGGGATNFLAATLGAEMQAGVPFYGLAPEPARVPAIKSPLLIQLAENDERINASYGPAFEAAAKAAGLAYEIHRYPGTQHGFHNNSTPRYEAAAAKLAWERTVAFFKKHLA